MSNNKHPDWSKLRRDAIPDGKYNFEYLIEPHRHFSHIPIPGYIENKDYPFTYNNALTHGSNKFSGCDGPKEFEKNLKEKSEDWKYRTKSVEYIVNSNGYRCKEWKDINWSEAIVLFGCSCTFGVGLAEDETISYHLAKLTGREVVNLGFPSGSNELIVNNCAAMIKNFGMPYGVVINWTTANRLRYYTPTEYHDLGPWLHPDPKVSHVYGLVDVQKLWEMTFVDPGNELAKNYYWSTYADAMFEGRTNYTKISFFGLSAHYTRSDKWFEIDNGARDRIHPGEQNSIEIATYLAERFK